MLWIKQKMMKPKKCFQCNKEVPERKKKKWDTSMWIVRENGEKAVLGKGLQRDEWWNAEAVGECITSLW